MFDTFLKFSNSFKLYLDLISAYQKDVELLIIRYIIYVADNLSGLQVYSLC